MNLVFKPFPHGFGQCHQTMNDLKFPLSTETTNFGLMGFQLFLLQCWNIPTKYNIKHTAGLDGRKHYLTNHVRSQSKKQFGPLLGMDIKSVYT